MALTDANGAIVEAYSYSPFGELTVHIDSEGPEVHQLRARPGEVWLELTEEIDLEVLEQAFADESASLTNTATTETIPVTLERPVATGKLAGRRIVIRPEGDPLPADTPLALHLPASSLEDLFGNEADEAFGGTFVEPTAETIIVDTAAPLLEAVVVRDARLELRFTEEPSEATWSAITLDGEPTSWTLAEDRYTLLAVDPLLPGTHTLTTPTAVTDLAGTALATPNALELDVPLTNATFVAFETPDPRTNPTSAADFRHTFHGLERDPTTGLVYARNRYYDPELGRFISADPLGYVDGPNAYAFAGNDPANLSDPLGLWTGEGCVPDENGKPGPNCIPEIKPITGNAYRGAAWAALRELPFSELVFDESGNLATPFNRPGQGLADIRAFETSKVGRGTRALRALIALRRPGAASKVAGGLEMISFADHESTSDPGDREYRGGPHAETKKPTGDDLESHHMPARSTSPLDPEDGPAIQMETGDHRRTSSHGSRGLEGAEYRARIRTLVVEGRWREAMTEEIRDVRRVAGTKYNRALREMLNYARKLGILEKKK